MTQFVYSKRPFGWEIEGKYTKKYTKKYTNK